MASDLSQLPPRIFERIRLEPPPITHDVQGRRIVGPCWTWLGEINRNGYGRLWLSGKRLMFHRVMWDLFRPDPGECFPLRDHLCRNRPCGNPDHLEPVTHAENTRRGDAILFKRAGS